MLTTPISPPRVFPSLSQLHVDLCAFAVCGPSSLTVPLSDPSSTRQGAWAAQDGAMHPLAMYQNLAPLSLSLVLARVSSRFLFQLFGLFTM